MAYRSSSRISAQNKLIILDLDILKHNLNMLNMVKQTLITD